MTRIRTPGIGRKVGRPEGWWKIYSTKKEGNNIVNIVDSLDYVKQTLIFRSLEGDEFVKLTLEDADGFPPDYTPQQSIKISLDTANLASALNSLIGEIGIYQNGSFLGNVSALDIVGATVTISGGVARIDIVTSGGTASHNISVSGTTINTAPITNINFKGPVSATETAPGNIDIDIEALEGLKIMVDGSAYSTLVDTINFTGIPEAISLSGKTVTINLSGVVFSEIQTYSQVYTGSSVISGDAVLSGFFGPNNPDGNDVIVAINGLVLEYNPVSSLSDFEVVGNNLVLKVSNIGYPLDPNDKVLSYYWV